MGFRPSRRYKLVFDGHPELEGFEVLTSTASIGELMDLTGKSDREVTTGLTLPGLAPESAIRVFASHILEWNLEDEQEQPVQPSYEAVIGLEVGTVTAMVKAWLEAVSGVSPSLGKESGSGATSEAELSGLASASQTLPS